MSQEIDEVFSVRKTRLTDNSVIWEIYQRGSDQRLGSAANEGQANDLKEGLNTMVEEWADRTILNTVDC